MDGLMSFLDSAWSVIDRGMPTLVGVVTLYIALLTFRVAKATKQIAEASHLVAEQSFEISQQSLDVAIKDWKQVGREAPWRLTKLYEDFWLLERLHHEPAAIIATDVHPQCSGAEMIFCNPSGMPIGAFRRTDRVVMKIPATNPGTDLVLYYREFTEDEALPTGPELFFIGPAWSDEGIKAREGTKAWATPLY